MTMASRKKADEHSVRQFSDEERWLSHAALLGRVTAAPTVIERRRWQVILLLAEQTPIAEIVAITGYRPRTIRQIVQRYRQHGPQGLTDGRQRHQTPALLSAAQEQALRKALRQPPPDGGAWTGPKVAQWMSRAIRKPVHRQRGWEYLQRLRSN